MGVDRFCIIRIYIPVGFKHNSIEWGAEGLIVGHCCVYRCTNCQCLIVEFWLSPVDDKSSQVEIFDWCRQAASHCLCQCWPKSMPPYGVITVNPKKYAHGFCFAVLCCGYTLTDFPISIRLTSLALWQSNDCPSASKVTLMNMDKYFMWIHYERLHNHNKAKHNKTVCIFLGIYCRTQWVNVNTFWGFMWR